MIFHINFSVISCVNRFIAVKNSYGKGGIGNILYVIINFRLNIINGNTRGCFLCGK